MARHKVWCEGPLDGGGRKIKGGRPRVVEETHTVLRLFVASILSPSTPLTSRLLIPLTIITVMSSTRSDDPPVQGVRDAAAASDHQWALAPPGPLDLGSPQSPSQHVSLSLRFVL